MKRGIKETYEHGEEGRIRTEKNENYTPEERRTTIENATNGMDGKNNDN